MGQTDRWISDEDSVFALLYYFQQPMVQTASQCDHYILKKGL